MTAAEFAAIVPAIVAVLGAMAAWLQANTAAGHAARAAASQQPTCRCLQDAPTDARDPSKGLLRCLTTC